MSKKRMLAGFLAATMALSCFTGCSTAKKSDLKGDMNEIVAATYGSEKIYLDEVNYYLRNTQQSYEFYYQMYGMTDVWSQESAVDSLFEEVLATIYQTKVLNEYAAANDISLSEDEQKLVSDKVDELASSDEKLMEVAGKDKDMLTEILTENAIANKAYYTIREAAEIKTTEDDCIKNAVSYILYKEAAAEAEDTEEADDETAPAETEAAYTEADANAALDQIKAGTAIDQVAKKAGLSVETGNYGAKDEDLDELGQAASTMKQGDSQVVYAEGVGWYVVTCTADKDEEASHRAYDAAVDQEKTDHFMEVYNGLDKQKYQVEDGIVKSLDVANTPVFEQETEAATEAATE